MAYFKIFRGTQAEVNAQSIVDGQMLYTTDLEGGNSLQIDIGESRKLIVPERVDQKIEETGTKINELEGYLDGFELQLAQKVNQDELLNGLTPKDGVKSWSQLQTMTTGNTIGDYYYCSDGDGINPAGNYRWTGNGWYFGGTGDEGYSKLKSDLDNVESNIFSSDDVTIRGIGNIPNINSLGEYSVGVGEDYIQVQANTNFLSRSFIAQRNGTLWVGDDILALSYCAIAVGTNPSGDWYDYSDTLKRISVSSTVRYRLSENNIPTETNKLNVKRGDIVVITAPNGSGALYIYGSVFSLKLNKNVELSDSNINQVADALKITKNTITKISDTLYDILLNGYTLHYKQIESGPYSRWNLLGIEIDGNILVSEATDILGPIRESNNTYISGVHGFENTKSLLLIVDGKTFDGEIGNVVEFDKLDIIHVSDVTSSVTYEVTWERFYHLTFTGKMLQVENNFNCVADTTVKRATNGGIFGSPNNLVNAIVCTNKLYDSLQTTETNETVYLADNTIEATWYYSGHSITMKNIVGHNDSGYKCIMAIYGNEEPVRTKIYFLTLDESKLFSVGDVICGKFMYEFN